MSRGDRDEVQLFHNDICKVKGGDTDESFELFFS